MDSGGVEELYRNYGILADAKDNAGEHQEAYECILAASKGTGGEKRLAAGFITKFLSYFPEMTEKAMNALLDLVVDEDTMIRRCAIKGLPSLCKGPDEALLCTKVADVLTQLLVTEDAVDLGLVKTAMSTVLQLNTAGALSGIFDQIMGGSDSVREKGIEYVSVSLMDMRHKLFIPSLENEQCLVELVKKVLVDVSGDEFESFMEILNKMQHLSTSEGSQQVIDIISEQAELEEEFQAENTESVDRFSACFRMAMKFSKKGGSVARFIQYVCQQVLPLFSVTADKQGRHEIVQLLAEGSMYLSKEDDLSDCFPSLYSFLLEHMPPPPDSEEGEKPNLQFAVVECALFTFHQLLKLSPDYLVGNEERLKEFRSRLQYFARGCQTYHNQLQVALKGKSSLELMETQNKLKSIALKATANISTLIKDFFYNPPSFKSTVQLSWGVKKSVASASTGIKRSPSQSTAGVASKRKHSPIRFESSGAAAKPATGGGTNGARRQPREIYHPPRDQFSKKVSNGSFQEFGTYRGRGRGRGRGGRGRRGRGFGGSWRKY